jgi:hypothetical protein
MHLAVGFEEVTLTWNRHILGGDASGHAIDCVTTHASICDRTFIPIVFVNVVKCIFTAGNVAQKLIYEVCTSGLPIQRIQDPELNTFDYIMVIVEIWSE